MTKTTTELTIELRPITGDLVDELTGMKPGSKLDAIRAARPYAREDTQRAYEELFDPRPEQAAEFTLAERTAVAAFVADLFTADNQRQPGAVALRAHYADLAQREAGEDLAAEVARIASDSAGTGPFGTYREPGLADESTDGVRLELTADQVAKLGERLAAALVHTHFLALRPREATRDKLDTLLAAGWSTTGIVTLSQEVSYLSYQVRLVAGLAALVASQTNSDQSNNKEA